MERQFLCLVAFDTYIKAVVLPPLQPRPPEVEASAQVGMIDED